MHSSPLKIQRGMQRQLQQWHETVAGRQQRLGWKIGFNMPTDQQRLGLPSAMVGFLSAAQQLRPGDSYPAPAGARLLVEPEVALQMGRDLAAGASATQAQAAIAHYSAALELVDTTRSADDDMEEILAANLFHDRVLLAEQRLPASAFRREQLALSLSMNQQPLRSLEPPRVPQDFSAIIITVANILAAHGEQLQSGDWIIAGAAATPVPVKAGDEIHLDMGELGQVGLNII